MAQPPSSMEALKAKRAGISALDQKLAEVWRLGRNLILAWSRFDATTLRLLAFPNHRLPYVIQNADKLLNSHHLRSFGKLEELSQAIKVKPLDLALPAAFADAKLSDDDIEHAVRRYGLRKVLYRSAVLFDIVDFHRRPAADQIGLLNSLSYSINVAESRLQPAGLPVDLGRSTTPTGYLVWNRSEGVQADLALYFTMMIALAENALTQEKSGQVPRLRACFSVGSHYEFHQPQGLAPAIYGSILGDLTGELNAMMSAALPGQILLSRFVRPLTDRAIEDNVIYKMIDTPRFMATAENKLSQMGEMMLSGERVSKLKSYLTGRDIGDGMFDIKQFYIPGATDTDITVFNVKINIFRKDQQPIYIGLQHHEIKEFDYPSESLQMHNEDMLLSGGTRK